MWPVHVIAFRFFGCKILENDSKTSEETKNHSEWTKSFDVVGRMEKNNNHKKFRYSFDVVLGAPL
jgi:hypothetical protein